jgi:hypothetical protein
VLLKNDGLLPLHREVPKIAVIGPNAASVRHLQGDYREIGGRAAATSTMITKRRIISAMLLLNVFMFMAISPVGIPAFTSRGMRPYAFGTEVDLHHVEELYKVLSLIPSNASVATIHEIFPHVCERLHAYCLKWPLDYPVDYILVDVKSPTVESLSQMNARLAFNYAVQIAEFAFESLS